MRSKPWVGVDLDGTLARGEDDPKKWSMATVGEPILPMVAKVKALMESGVTVKIFTARVGGLYSDNINARIQAELARRVVAAWTKEVFGFELEVVAYKDMDTLEIWDDIAISVVRNTGEFAVNAFMQS